MRTKQTVFKTMAIGCIALAAAHGGEIDSWPGLRERLASCAGPDDPVSGESMSDFAERQGKSKADLAAKLVELIKAGMEEYSKGGSPGLAKSALWGLGEVGGEKEEAFVWEIMRSQDGYFRAIAIPVGIRMVPEKWEAWVRGIATDNRYDDHDRYLAYREAFQLGKEGNGDMRNRVIEVLKEMRSSDPRRTNRNRLGLWLTELEEKGWEEWLRKVASEEGFYNADRYGAYELAFRVGRDGDENTRRHVIAVLTEMLERDAFYINRNQLERWIEELKAL